MMTFTYQYNKHSPKVTVTIKDGDVTLDEVLTQFEGFLKAAGYHVPSELEFKEETNA